MFLVGLWIYNLYISFYIYIQFLNKHVYTYLETHTSGKLGLHTWILGYGVHCL